MVFGSLKDLNDAWFARVATAYRKQWGATLCVVDPAGDLVRSCGCPECGADVSSIKGARRHVVQEALRWGEPTILDHPPGLLLWAVPLMCNAALLGGIVACISEDEVLPTGNEGAVVDLRKACADLRSVAERHNLTNADFLAHKRQAYRREQRRAETIHELKLCPTSTILERYFQEEPALVSAIRRGNRQEAIGIMNQILVDIFAYGQGKLRLIKSFILELIVTMSRTAVQAGGAPEDLLGHNYANLVALDRIHSEEALTHWLVEMLNGIMDSIEHHGKQPSLTLLQHGIDFVCRHYDQPITRDDAAQAAHMSGSHFSRLLKEKSGRSFTDLLHQVRVDRAAELLRQTEDSILQIAFTVGFSDQSYFTKVFRRYMHVTPGEYRERRRRR